MSEQPSDEPADSELSPADTALRARITRLSVHLPCGRIRGPVPADSMWSKLRGAWQSCPCEDSPEEWRPKYGNFYFSHAIDLCLVCARGTAGSPVQWAWLACDDCRAVNGIVGLAWQTRPPLALARHSLMNGIGIRHGAPREIQVQQATELANFFLWDKSLREWFTKRFAHERQSFRGVEDVPLATWQKEHPPSLTYSTIAIAQLLNWRDKLAESR